MGGHGVRLQGDAQGLSVKTISYRFLVMFSGMHFSAYLLLMVLYYFR